MAHYIVLYQFAFPFLLGFLFFVCFVSCCLVAVSFIKLYALLIFYDTV